MLIYIFIHTLMIDIMLGSIAVAYTIKKRRLNKKLAKICRKEI